MRIDVHKLADEAKFNRFHALVLFWGVVILILDGYDLAVVGAAGAFGTLAVMLINHRLCASTHHYDAAKEATA